MINKLRQSRLGQKGKEIFHRLLQDSRDYFFCMLPAPTGYLSSWFLKVFFSGIRVDPDQIHLIQNIPKDAIIVYVNKYRSRFEYLFYHTRYHALNLPVPEIWMDNNVVIWQRLSRIFRIFLTHAHHAVTKRHILTPYKSGYIRRALTGNKTGMLSLVGKKGFDRWFMQTKTAPLNYLIELQRETNRPIFLVPQLQFYNRKPTSRSTTFADLFFGSRSRPGQLRRMVTMIRKPGKVFVEIASPLNLMSFLAAPEHQDRDEDHLALLLRRKLLQRINQHRQSITGPTIKHHEELREEILTSERLRKYMQHHAESKKIPIHKVRKKAAGYVDEIAARYRPAFVNVAAYIIRWIIKTLFDGVTVNNNIFVRLKALSRRGPLIFVPCHKSHMDYLILPYILYKNNLPAPHIVAGKNMFFPPFGAIARAAGGFSIRRSFRGAAFYSKVFSEYVYKLLQEGFNIKIFIEGTRSRSGKLLTPKLGFLSILLNAYKNGACRDMSFVPIFIGYDRVLEEKSYLYEQEGGEKKPESIWQVIRARKIFKTKWGRVSIRINEPLLLSSLEAECAQPIEEMGTKELNHFCRDLGFRIINAIDRSSIVTPYGLVAAALLNSDQDRITYDHLMSHIDTYLNYLGTRDTELADTLVLDSAYAVSQVLETYIQNGYIERMSGDKNKPLTEEVFNVLVNKRSNLEFYKNSCIIFFVPAAITALTILQHDAFQFSSADLHTRYAELQSLLKNEFAYDLDQTSDYYVRKCIKAFIDEAVLIPHPTMPDTYNLTSAGFRKLKFFSGFLKPYLESYWIVLNVLSEEPKSNIKPKRQLKKITSAGNRMYRKKEVSRREALSQINYANAVAYFRSKGIRGGKGADQIKKYQQMIRQYLSRLS